MRLSIVRSIESRGGGERLLWVSLLLFVSVISFSIAVSHILLAFAVFFYLHWKYSRHRHFPSAPIQLPAFLFICLTLISASLSANPSFSLYYSKSLVLFIIIPVFYDTVRDLRDMLAVYELLILAGIISAAYAILQFFSADGNPIDSRITGFLGHWMTFSGLLMIWNVLLLSQLLFMPQRSFWMILGFAVLFFALLLSLTRNAWLGFLAASFALIAMRKSQWVIAIPAVLFLIFAGAVLFFPYAVAERIVNIFDVNDTSNKDRLQMLQGGWGIIKDYPFTGVGTNMIRQVYPRYRVLESISANHQHLHNNLLQFAAESGIPALLAWLWFVGKIVQDLIRWKRSAFISDAAWIINGTLGVVIAVFVAGVFEYNFGDSEIKMLFLILITLPYAWEKSRQKAALQS